MGSLQCAEDDVFVRDCEIDVCGAAASPTAGYGDEDFGEFFDEGGLLFGSDHDVAIAEFRGGEGRENTSADAEVGGAHMGALLDAGEGKGETTEVVDVQFGGPRGDFSATEWVGGWDLAEKRRCIAVSHRCRSYAVVGCQDSVAGRGEPAPTETGE